jgi:hypothetical protein
MGARLIFEFYGKYLVCTPPGAFQICKVTGNPCSLAIAVKQFFWAWALAEVRAVMVLARQGPKIVLKVV